MRPVPRSSWTTTICVRGLYILRCCEKSAGAVLGAGKFGRKNWPSAVAGRRVRSFAAGAMGANQSNQIDPKGQRENGSAGRYVQPKIRTKTLPCARRAFLLKLTPLLLASRALQFTTRTKQRTSWRRRCARWRLDRRTERDIGRQASTVWWAAHLQAGR